MGSDPNEATVKSNFLLGRYQVVRQLGRGMMGEVLEVVDRVSGQPYALKRLPVELTRDQNHLRQIRDNFAIVGKLAHPHIITLRTLEEDPATGEVFLLMDLVRGVDLGQWISERRRQHDGLEIDLVLGIIEQIASALDHAHAQPIIVGPEGNTKRYGILHRDLKPANVMVEADREHRKGIPLVRLADFGLAAEVQASLQSLSIGVRNPVAGTPVYMAPEQWEGRTLTRGVDQWALAVLTYEMIAGHRPFSGPTETALRENVCKGDPEVPPALTKSQWQALRRAMSVDRRGRYSSCAEFVLALASADPATKTRVSLPLPDFPDEPRTKILKRSKRRAVILAVAAATVLGVIGLAVQEYRRREILAAVAEVTSSMPRSSEIRVIDEALDRARKALVELSDANPRDLDPLRRAVMDLERQRIAAVVLDQTREAVGLASDPRTLDDSILRLRMILASHEGEDPGTLSPVRNALATVTKEKARADARAAIKDALERAFSDEELREATNRLEALCESKTGELNDELKETLATLRARQFEIRVRFAKEKADKVALQPNEHRQALESLQMLGQESDSYPGYDPSELRLALAKHEAHALAMEKRSAEFEAHLKTLAESVLANPDLALSELTVIEELGKEDASKCMPDLLEGRREEIAQIRRRAEERKRALLLARFEEVLNKAMEEDRSGEHGAAAASASDALSILGNHPHPRRSEAEGVIEAARRREAEDRLRKKYEDLVAKAHAKWAESGSSGDEAGLQDALSDLDGAIATGWTPNDSAVKFREQVRGRIASIQLEAKIANFLKDATKGVEEGRYQAAREAIDRAKALAPGRHWKDLEDRIDRGMAILEQRSYWDGGLRILQYKGKEYIVGVDSTLEKEWPLIGTTQLAEPKKSWWVLITRQNAYIVAERASGRLICLLEAHNQRDGRPEKHESTDWISQVFQVDGGWKYRYKLVQQYDKENGGSGSVYDKDGEEDIVPGPGGELLISQPHTGKVKHLKCSMEVADEKAKKLIDYALSGHLDQK